MPCRVEITTPEKLVYILQSYINAETTEGKAKAMEEITSFITNYFNNIQPRDLDSASKLLKEYFETAYARLQQFNSDILKTEVVPMVDTAAICAGMAQTPGMWNG